jgi:tryptophanyl-tRNA synthetase
MMEKTAIEIDPWASELPQDQEKLFKSFGLEEISPSLKKRFETSRLFRRNIIIAHRDLAAWLKAADEKKPVAIMSGIKPSGEFHLGSKQTAEEIIFFQKEFGAKVYYCIADLEACADNGISFEESKANAISNVADLLALGLDPENAYIYRQSLEPRVIKMAFRLSRRVTPAMMEAIYGKKPISLQMAVLVQMGDILLPQSDDFGGKKHVLVPVGLDQDPHIRLCRDLAFKERLVPPAATYHKFVKNLKGEAKMSKRDPDSLMWLSEDLESVKKKFMCALTGGRDTAQEQRRIGGNISACIAYDIFMTHFEPDDKKLEKRFSDCTQGKILCGECKAQMVEQIIEWFKSHQEKRRKMMKKAQEIIEMQEE